MMIREVSMKPTLLFVVIPLLLLLGGCTAHVLSRNALLDVDPNTDFNQVKSDTQAHLGKTLVLGGMIIGNQLNQEGTTLEVLRYSLNRWGEPQKVDEAGGRFLARSDRILDPELYKPSLFVTLTGVLRGEETGTLQNYDYVYPVFQITEIHVWNRFASYPPYGYYPWGPYPNYYGDPFWYHDPFWPYPHRRYPSGWWRP
jgi:outer membrane lipoprotein